MELPEITELIERAEVDVMIERNLKSHEYLQGNEKCSNSPETDWKERGRFLYECGQTGKSAGIFPV